MTFAACETLAANAQIAIPLTPDLPAASSQGTVLFAVRWDRKWKCGAFENVQLKGLSFDKLPSVKGSDSDGPDLAVVNPTAIATRPGFTNYAFVVEPGDYGLSWSSVVAARSISDVQVLTMPRSILIKAGQSLGGSFSVAPGETVYIGHFFVDCARQPVLWRYYADGRAAFNKYLENVKREYPTLDVSNVKFRLFKTKAFGEDYELTN